MPAITTHPDGYLSALCGQALASARRAFLPTELQRRPRRSDHLVDSDALAFALSSRPLGPPQPLHAVMSRSLSLLASRRVTIHAASAIPFITDSPIVPAAAVLSLPQISAQSPQG
jgi:hypothetical protein